MNIKRTAIKVTAFACIAGVVLLSNAPVVSAYEAHIINVTATIVDDGVDISPNGGKFCNDGKLKVEMTSKTEGAKVFYTTDGSEPKCDSGKRYFEPFTLSGDATVRAVACYDGKAGSVVSEFFDIASGYCQTSLKINKVYYYADVNHGGVSRDYENEWVEIYNPTEESVNVKGWSVCNSESCDKLSSQDLAIPAKGYAVVAYKESTWSYWNIPESAVKINLSSVIGSGLGNTADMVLLENAAGETVDQMNWGVADSRWNNYNANVWAKGVSAASAQGKILGRSSNGYDTDSVADWKIFDLPRVGVQYPNGEETWIVGNTYTIKWTALNSNGDAGRLGIDIYYSADSGKTWASVAKNTANDGAYEWKFPLAMRDNGSNYFTASGKARIKVVATDYGRNFMFTGKDVSDRDFYFSINKSLLTAEEAKLLSETDTTGMTFVNSRTAAVMEVENTTQSSDNSDGKKSTETKPSVMLNREEDDFSIDEQFAPNEDAKDKGKTDMQALTDVGKQKGQSVVEIVTMKADLASAGDPEQKTVTTTTTDAVDSTGVTAQKTAPEIDDMPITPDGDTTIEFNLNS